MTLVEAQKIIEELKLENSKLREENTKLMEENTELKRKKPSGRKVHNESWAKSYNDFAIRYENGETVKEIVDSSSISLRTAYRYLAYYKSLNDSALCMDNKEHDKSNYTEQNKRTDSSKK